MNKSILNVSRSLWKVGILSFMLLLCGWKSFAYAQETKVSMNEFLQDTQKMSEKADEVKMVWWIPGEFWQVTADQDPYMETAEAEQIIKALSPYTVIVAVDGKVGAFGGVTYENESTMRKSIHLIDNQGKNYRPLSEDKIDVNAKNFILATKPVLANILGPMGQNITEAKKKGSFSIKLGDSLFKWRLPLGSLLPPKTCPVCGEKMSGAWKYCPWDGSELK